MRTLAGASFYLAIIAVLGVALFVDGPLLVAFTVGLLAFVPIVCAAFAAVALWCFVTDSRWPWR